MTTSYNRGHLIKYLNGVWVYFDNDEPILNNERPCKKCNMPPTKEGYDNCLGHIEGVASACCGHGVEIPYIVKNSETIK
jgi:hypothetical protein